ncbi:MAG: hypothetical protein P8I55_04885 [Crocinitomix sp.]|nr:hypothetical protein [Crocinitomix sp.]
MKNSFIIGSALMLCFTITSCGGKKALDINVSELETACDVVDALDLIATEMNAMVADGEVGSDEEEEFGKLVDKIQEVDEVARTNFERTDAEACEKWDAMRKKSEDLEPYM